jgi:hypothetical protein
LVKQSVRQQRPHLCLVLDELLRRAHGMQLQPLVHAKHRRNRLFAATPTHVLFLVEPVKLVKLVELVELVKPPGDTAVQGFLFQHKLRTTTTTVASLFPLFPSPSHHVCVPRTEQPRATFFHGTETQQVQQQIGTTGYLWHRERTAKHQSIRLHVQVHVQVKAFFSTYFGRRRRQPKFDAVQTQHAFRRYSGMEQLGP